MPLYDNADLLSLTPEERRGAKIALSHVRRRGEAMKRTGHADAPGVMSPSDRQMLRQAAGLVCNISRVVERDMQPDLKPWHIDPQ